MTQGPLWILSWDGAAPWMVERALRDGATPNLERLRARGVYAAGSVTDSPDPTTPPGHAILWTGVPASQNGITSFRIPHPSHPERLGYEWKSGFDATQMKAEPLWVTALKAGRSVTLVHTPLSGPAPYWDEHRPFGLGDTKELTIYHGYGEPAFPGGWMENPKLRPSQDWKGLDLDFTGALEFQFRARPLSVPVLLPREEDGSYRRCYIARDKRAGSPGAWLEPGPKGDFSPPIELEIGLKTQFRLFDLKPDGSGLKLYSAPGFHPDFFPESRIASYHEALGSFPGGGAYRLYGDGAFGPPLADSKAEALYLETHLAAMQHFRASSLFALDRAPADLMIFYHPGIDEACHLWAGLVQPEGPAFDANLDAMLWPHFLEVFREADRHLGALLDRLPEDGHLILVSDHGISGIHRHFLPNVVLRDAGLLRHTRRHRDPIDWKKTRAFYHPANNGFVFLHDERFPRGQAIEDRAARIEEVKEALMKPVDPETGRSILAHVLDVSQLPESSEYRGQGRGDLYLVLRPGYSMGETFHRQALLPAHLKGHHQQMAGLRAHHAIFLATGKRLRRDHALGILQHPDVHETARSLLALEPGTGPGKVLTQAFLEDT